RTLAYDVKFADTLEGSPTVIWYIAYSGVSAGGNVVKIRSARLVLGQTRKAGWPVIPERVISVSTAELSNAANGVNIHRKKPGRTVMESTSGKMRYAMGSAPTDAWRAYDGSGDLTPA